MRMNIQQRGGEEKEATTEAETPAEEKPAKAEKKPAKAAKKPAAKKAPAKKKEEK